MSSDSAILKNSALDGAVQPWELSAVQTLRATGAMLGCAVRDALGAPLELGQAGLFSTMFPRAVHEGCAEMIGGGAHGRAPGEFADDTQMSLALAAALREVNGYDPEVVWRHFSAWVGSAVDAGNTTRAALSRE